MQVFTVIGLADKFKVVSSLSGCVAVSTGKYLQMFSRIVLISH
jgi:hypothetical protein